MATGLLTALVTIIWITRSLITFIPGAPMREMLDKAEKRVPIGRWCNRTEIAETVLYLASDLGSHVSGTTLVCDGGAWLTQTNDIISAEQLMRNAKL